MTSYDYIILPIFQLGRITLNALLYAFTFVYFSRKQTQNYMTIVTKRTENTNMLFTRAFNTNAWRATVTEFRNSFSASILKVIMFIRAFSGNTCSLIACLIFPFLACASDSVASSLLFQKHQTVSSNNSMFTLGFFSPQNSTNRYVGIWFMSKSFVVWVANRNNPLTDSSGTLTISKNGNLLVLNGQKRVVWSTNVSQITSNSSVQLLDSGNLVLIDRTTGEFLWQSFQHPSNAYLPGMELSTNTKTGKKVQLTSWKSTSDPSYGEFSCSLESHNVTELFVWKGNNPYWRSGPWDGTAFLGMPWMVQSVFQNGFQIKEEEGIFHVSFVHLDKSNLETIILDSEGVLKPFIWNPRTNIWDLKTERPFYKCDVYGTCGPFGICNSLNSPICSCLKGFEPKNKEEWARQTWSSGCIRREPLKCERKINDGFFRLEKIKPPDHAEVIPSNPDNTIDCKSLCLRNCSCMAYANDRSLGCMVWNVDLLDLQIFPTQGADFYMRLAHSELGIDKRKMTTAILISLLIGIVFIAAFGYFLWKKVIKQKGKMCVQIHNSKSIRILKPVYIQELSLFDFRKLATATNNFDSANKLGEGGFGIVYKGKFEDGQEIAIKRLSRSSRQGMEEFINEVELISKLQHQNLVKLIGCCIEEEEILVYEFMPNKSLDAHIFDPLGQKSLDWGKRFNIIEGIVRGLLYLHRDSRLRIIHRDLKASNILLDEGMNPKISDFGLARLFGGSEDQAKTKRIVGTYGYISPEYALQGCYSEKSDVFSFGILLLEIISGRKNTSFYKEAESFTLIGFAWNLWIDGNVMPLIDPQIYDPSFHKDILRCIHIGLLCVQELAIDRPTMAFVMSMLQSEIADISPPSQPAFILRQTMSRTAKQIPNNEVLCSINNVTISNFEGR